MSTLSQPYSNISTLCSVTGTPVLIEACKKFSHGSKEDLVLVMANALPTLSKASVCIQIVTMSGQVVQDILH